MAEWNRTLVIGRSGGNPGVEHAHAIVLENQPMIPRAAISASNSSGHGQSAGLATSPPPFVSSRHSEATAEAWLCGRSRVILTDRPLDLPCAPRGANVDRKSEDAATNC